jgi:hypothetical protein
VELPAGTGTVAVSAPLSGLVPGTTYVYQLSQRTVHHLHLPRVRRVVRIALRRRTSVSSSVLMSLCTSASVR